MFQMKLFIVLTVLVAVLCTVEAKHRFCSVCEKVVKEGENGGEEALKLAIDRECALTLILAKECREFLDKEVDKIMKKLNDHETPEKICHDIDLC